MMLKLRKLAIVLLANLVVFALGLSVKDVHSLSTTAVSSNLILDDGFDVVPDGAGNFYIFSYDKENNQTAITKFDTSSLTSIQFFNSSNMETPLKTLNHGYAAVYYSNSQPSNSNFGNDSLNLFYMDISNYLVQYRYSTRTTQWHPISSIALSEKPDRQNTEVGSNGDIFIFASGSNSVAAYNDSGKIDKTKLTTNGPIAAITTDISRTYLYAATNNKLYRYKISDGTYAFENSTIDGNFAPFKFLTDNIFITSAGKICMLNDSKFELKNTAEIQVNMENYPACVDIAGFDNASILAKTAEKVVSRIRCSDGAVTGTIEFSEKILAVATSGKKTIVVTGDATATNIHLITADDITEVTPAQPSTPAPGDGNEGDDVTDSDENGDETQTPGTPSDEPLDPTITSDEYKIDEEKSIIYKIPAGTTLGALKNGLTFNGSLVLKDSSGNTKTAASTKVATGYTVIFVKDGAEYKTFTLIVEGDVTGSGNISSKSISALTNHLLGKSELEGVYLEAADLSGNNDLSTVDLLLMYKETQK